MEAQNGDYHGRSFDKERTVYYLVVNIEYPARVTMPDWGTVVGFVMITQPPDWVSSLEPT